MAFMDQKAPKKDIKKWLDETVKPYECKYKFSKWFPAKKAADAYKEIRFNKDTKEKRVVMKIEESRWQPMIIVDIEREVSVQITGKNKTDWVKRDYLVGRYASNEEDYKWPELRMQPFEIFPHWPLDDKEEEKECQFYDKLKRHKKRFEDDCFCEWVEEHDNDEEEDEVRCDEDGGRVDDEDEEDGGRGKK